MEALLTFFEQYLHKVLFAIIILSGIYITQFTKEILPKIGVRYKVLFTATFVAVFFYIIEGGDRLTLSRYIITYALATSFYEIIGHWILLKVKKRFGTNEDEEKKHNFGKQSTDIGGDHPDPKKEEK